MSFLIPLVRRASSTPRPANLFMILLILSRLWALMAVRPEWVITYAAKFGGDMATVSLWDPLQDHHTTDCHLHSTKQYLGTGSLIQACSLPLQYILRSLSLIHLSRLCFTKSNVHKLRKPSAQFPHSFITQWISSDRKMRQAGRPRDHWSTLKTDSTVP